MAADFHGEGLPPYITYGVTRDGRVFFVNDRLQITSWINPITGQPVQTGHKSYQGLPNGWEQAVTPEGAIYFIDHNSHTTTFQSPQAASPPRSPPVQSKQPSSNSPPPSPNRPVPKSPLKSPTKPRSLKAPAPKREETAMVTIKGWLYRQESGIKTWKKRWCVLADYSIFFYKDDKEKSSVGSILLPSYRIETCLSRETNKKFSFKAEHNNMKTYYFATDSQDDQDRWVNALKMAAMLKAPPRKIPEPNNNTQKLVPKSPHLTWDDDEDDNDYRKNYWGRGPPPTENGQISPHSPQDDINKSSKSAFNPYQSQGHSRLQDDHHGHGQGHPHSQGDRVFNRDMGSKNDGHESRQKDPRYQQSHGSHSYNQNPHETGHRGQSSRSDRNNLRNDGERPQSLHDPRSMNPAYDPYDRNVRHPTLDNSQSNRHRPVMNDSRDNMKTNYSDSAYDKHDGRSRFPNSRSPQQSPIDDPQTGEYLYSKPIKRQDRVPHGYPDQAYSRSRPNNQSERSVGQGSVRNKSDENPYMQMGPGRSLERMDRSSERPDLISSHSNMQPPFDQRSQGEYRTHSRETSETSNYGYYSPQKAELQQRELMMGKEKRDSLDPFSRRSRSEQQDDGYSTLTKYQGSQDHQPQPQQPSYSPQNSLNYRSSQPETHSEQTSRSNYQDPPSRSNSNERPRSSYNDQHQLPRDNYRDQSSIAKYQQHLPRSSQNGHPSRNDFQGQQSRLDSSNEQPSSYTEQPSRVSYSERPRSSYGEQDHDQNLHVEIPHTYVNISDALTQRDLYNSDESTPHVDLPNRPPLPTAVRSQIVEELAKTKTPTTSQELLEAERAVEQRMMQPAFFNYPTPTVEEREGPFNTRNDQGAYQQYDDRQQTRGRDSRHEQQHQPRSYNDERNQNYGESKDNRFRGRERSGEYPAHGRGERNSSRQLSNLPTKQQVEDDMRMLGQISQLQPEGGNRYGMPRKGGKSGRTPATGMIHTVKEDPDMPDSQIIETSEIPNINKKYPGLSGPRLRMSISAGDLVGKTHDELVLLLIQLRREQASVEYLRNYYRERLDTKRPQEQQYRKMQQEMSRSYDDKMEADHREYKEMKYQCEEVEKKLEVYRPLVNLVHNMVNMGSLYGGDNFMLASQYRKHLLSPDEYSAPKKMLEFSRKHQEEVIVKGIKNDIKQLTQDEVQLEEKLERLYELDRQLQEQSFKVTSFQEDKDLLEKALQGILRQQDMSRDNPRDLDKLLHQQRMLEKELSRVMHHLAEASKELEETTAENNKIEHEVTLLRSKVQGDLNRSKSAPALSDENYRNKMKMEKDLARVKDIMEGLNEQGAQLSEIMKKLRRSSSGGGLESVFQDTEVISPKSPMTKRRSPSRSSSSTYMETDLDTKESKDLSQVHDVLSSFNSMPTTHQGYESANGMPLSNDPYATIVSQKNESLQLSPSQNGLLESHTEPSGPVDFSDADENTKRFFGIIPKEKPKVLTVRDVKRHSEQRKELHKTRKDQMYDPPLSPSDSNQTKSSTDPTKFTNDHHVYENLPPIDPNRKPWSSVLPSNSSSNQSSRRSSLLCMAPRPFVPFHQQQAANTSPLTFSRVEPSAQSSRNMYEPQTNNDDLGVVKATRVIIQPSFNSMASEAEIHNQSAVYTPKPYLTDSAPITTGLFNVKRTPRGRYMTISSSEPVKLETSLIEPKSLHTSAGDLMTNNSMDMVPDIVRSSTLGPDRDIDDARALDREVLYMPSKVEIPERYMPESDEEEITEEERLKREEKAEKIKQILTKQSIGSHSVSQPDVSKVAGQVHEKVKIQKQETALLLQLNQELANQVKNVSRKAAAERRKTWSGSPSKIPRNEAMDQEDLEVDRTMGSMEYLGPHHRRQENLYI